jgi:glycosyltransferase involved in cell wall biosynthesis
VKISVLTATYNRANFLERIYNSILNNITSDLEDVDIEWLIMNDGSTDNTKEVVDKFIQEGKTEIKYFCQENKGKMASINKLVDEATGELIVDCDSDDFFTDDAFKIIKEEYEKNTNETEEFYGLCFLKYDTCGNNMGNEFKHETTTMFDLYFKEGETGEKALVFYADIRKRYKHKLENGEKFVTEARMYHKMDENYKILCINKPIMICEYQESGYTNNIMEQFEKYPYGYYKYFQEILHKNMSGVLLKKRLYAIKHLLLSAYFIYKGKKKIKGKDY